MTECAGELEWQASKAVRVAPPAWWLAITTALAGAVLAAYLGLLPASAYGNLPGGYAWVLSVKWGWLLGIRVVWWLAAAFLCATVGLILVYPRQDLPMRRLGWRLLLALGAGLIAWCAWYLALLFTQQFDFFCRTLFALSGLAFVCGWLLLQLARVAQRDEGSLWGSDAARPPIKERRRLFAAALGTGACMIALQAALPPTLAARWLALEQSAKLGYDSGPGPRRLINPMGSRAMIVVGKAPLIGPASAPVIVTTMCDYTDMNSRMAYQEVKRFQQRYGDQVAILPIVCPQDRECNPAAPQSVSGPNVLPCVLAKLSLAVWVADASKFASFHDFLMSPDDLRQSVTADQAMQRANELVGADALQRALADPRTTDQLRKNLLAATSDLREEGSDAVPVTMWGPNAGKPGRYYSGRVDASQMASEIEQVWPIRPLAQGDFMKLLEP